MIAIDETKHTGFNAFPDQENRNVKIDLNKHYKSILIELLTHKGHLLSRTQFNDTNQIDIKLSDCFPGFYNLKVKTDKEYNFMDLIISD